jgi:hypothetical protein
VQTLEAMSCTTSSFDKISSYAIQKYRLVHSINGMEDILSLGLNAHFNITPEYLTIRSIICNFQVQGEPVIQSIEQTVETGTYKFLYHVGMEKICKGLVGRNQ